MSETATTETTDDGSAGTHELPIGVDGATVPAQEIVTGRGFITGKSGSGKSNSVTVLLEELFELGLGALVIDTDGEYYPLKERYDVLHVGADDDADTIVDESDADRLAEIAVGDGVPIILDVSAFDGDATEAVVEETVRALFTRAKRERRPYLLCVEEIHEYLPQKGSDDLSELLTTVAKRGRKYGLGILGASQRPSSVDKDFITQANWMVWHRLTYETDTKKAGKNLGKGYKEPISSLDDGEAFVQGDWLESVQTLQFRKKHVHDAGATPDIAPFVDSPTVHDTDALLERFDTGESEADETARDGAGDDSECNGKCETADRLREHVASLERDVQRAEFHRRAAERLAVDVQSLRGDLDETEHELRSVKGGLERTKDRCSELKSKLETCQQARAAGETVSVDGDVHTTAVAEIVGEHFGVRIGDVYDRYRDRVDDPRSKKTVQRRLSELADAGAVVATGKNSGRRYYPLPDDLETPDHATPAEVVAAVRDAETLFELQRELRIQRKDAKKIADVFEHATIGQANANNQAEQNVLSQSFNGDSDKVTARVPKPLIRAAERAVGAGEYPSMAEMYRDGFRHVVETTDAATIDE